MSDYQKGYAAGLKRGKREAETAALHERKQGRDDGRDALYAKCLELALAQCSGWKVGGEVISNAKGYCVLARIFLDHSISELDK